MKLPNYAKIINFTYMLYIFIVTFISCLCFGYFGKKIMCMKQLTDIRDYGFILFRDIMMFNISFMFLGDKSEDRFADQERPIENPCENATNNITSKSHYYSSKMLGNDTMNNLPQTK